MQEVSSQSMYQHTDGSPRYGIRTLEGAGSATAVRTAASPEAIARQAAGFSRTTLAAAALNRLTKDWADQEDPLVTALRQEYVWEARQAKSMVRQALGSNQDWLNASARVFHRSLKPVHDRRRAAGRTRAAWIQRAVLFLVLLAPPLLLVITEAPIAWLLAAGIVSAVLAKAGGDHITARLGIPVAPPVPALRLKELRRDIEDAVLLAILQGKGTDIGAETAAAAGRGWDNLAAAGSADRLG
jgi:hypothetical protein